MVCAWPSLYNMFIDYLENGVNIEMNLWVSSDDDTNLFQKDERHRDKELKKKTQI